MGFAKTLSGLYFRLTGWKFVVDCPIPNGGVLVGAPHTSNWDWALMMAIAAQTGMKLRWLGKKSLFTPPLGPILRGFGGVPVDRGNSHGLVEDMAQTLRDTPGLFIAITPEGTRSGAKYWKSGFYRIAEAAGAPLVLCYVDSKTRTTGLGETFMPSGNVGEDMDRIRSFYAGKVGIKPGRTMEPRLREEDS